MRLINSDGLRNRDQTDRKILNPLSNNYYQVLLALCIQYICVLFEEVIVLFSFIIEDVLVLELIFL